MDKELIDRANEIYNEANIEAIYDLLKTNRQLEALTQELFSQFSCGCSLRGIDGDLTRCNRTTDKCTLGTCLYYGGLP